MRSLRYTGTCITSEMLRCHIWHHHHAYRWTSSIAVVRHMAIALCSAEDIIAAEQDIVKSHNVRRQAPLAA